MGRWSHSRADEVVQSAMERVRSWPRPQRCARGSQAKWLSRGTHAPAPDSGSRHLAPLRSTLASAGDAGSADAYRRSGLLTLPGPVRPAQHRDRHGPPRRKRHSTKSAVATARSLRRLANRWSVADLATARWRRRDRPLAPFIRSSGVDETQHRVAEMVAHNFFVNLVQECEPGFTLGSLREDQRGTSGAPREIQRQIVARPLSLGQCFLGLTQGRRVRGQSPRDRGNVGPERHRREGGCVGRPGPERGLWSKSSLQPGSPRPHRAMPRKVKP